MTGIQRKENYYRNDALYELLQNAKPEKIQHDCYSFNS